MDAELWQELRVSEAGHARLRLLAGLVEKWTARINLVARSTLADLWARHIDDSARILRFIGDPPRLWADFGSGAGFPGLVVAVVLADWRAETVMVLVESDQRKATFLREAARQMSVPIVVRAERVESIAPLEAEIISARAFAPLDTLCGLLGRHLAEDGRALLPKGAAWASEVEAARKNWSFDLEVHDDPGHKGAVILELRNLNRAGH